jgi:hypothetical protein
LKVRTLPAWQLLIVTFLPAFVGAVFLFGAKTSAESMKDRHPFLFQAWGGDRNFVRNMRSLGIGFVALGLLWAAYTLSGVAG